MSSITVLNQLIDDEEGIYRVRHGNQVGYLTITADVFDEDTLCRPHLLIPILPELPNNGWTRMKITRSDVDGSLQATRTNDPLPEIQTLWHPQRIDILSLKQIKRHRSNVHEVDYSGVAAITKIAAFDWEIPRLERETWAYMMLHQQRQQLDEPNIFPQVLGHLTESGRVIGLLLEKLDGRFASLSDLAKCTETLKKLHRFGLTHGDINRYNLIVSDRDGSVRMVDFEQASAFDEAAAKKELESLEDELNECTGRGGPAVLMTRRIDL